MATANAHKIVKGLLSTREQTQTWLAGRTGYRVASISMWITKGFRTDAAIVACLKELDADADTYRRCGVSEHHEAAP